MKKHKKRKKTNPLRRCVACEHCGLLFNEISFAENVGLKICPDCGEPLNRQKMLRQYNIRNHIVSGKFFCPVCGSIHSRKNADKNNDIYCKKCKRLIAHIGKAEEIGA